MNLSLILTGASALALAAGAGAAAQPHGGAPGFGAAAFDGAAQAVPARAGGALSLEALGCAGYSTIAPTLAVDVSAPGPLYIAAGSVVDLTLAVRGPDGAVSCADDEAGGLNPGVRFSDAAPGRYEIWAGTFGAGEGYPPIALNLSPDGFDTANPHELTPDAKAAPAQSLRLRGGFRDDPRRVTVTAGGAAPMSALDFACVGQTGEAPALALDYGGGDLPLHLLVESATGSEDTTLAVVTPGGEVLCDDDTIGFDAGVRIEAPEPGRYAVFAGLLADRDETAEVTLSVSEIGFGGLDRRLDVAGEPVFGVHDLAGGFQPDPAVFEIDAGGPADIEMALGETGFGCRGYASRTPSLRVRYDGRGPLFISMESDADTTLAINAPDGSWACDDDGLGDLDPVVFFETAEPGVYDIYAATYSEGLTTPAMLYVSETGGGANPAERTMDAGLDAAAAAALAPGFAPEAGRFTVTAGGPAEPYDTGEAFCTGYYTAAPSLALDWAGGPLSLATQGDLDSTLAVRLPDGRWACDDDGGEGVLSRLATDGMAGRYSIWVGSYGGREADAVLVLEGADAAAR